MYNDRQEDRPTCQCGRAWGPSGVVCVLVGVGAHAGDEADLLGADIESPYLAAILGVLASVPDGAHIMAAVVQAERARGGSAKAKQPGHTRCNQ